MQYISTQNYVSHLGNQTLKGNKGNSRHFSLDVYYRILCKLSITLNICLVFSLKMSDCPF